MASEKSIERFEAEYQILAAEKDQLLPTHEGEWVLVCAKRSPPIMGFYDSFLEGHDAALAEFGADQSFLLHRLSSEPRGIEAPAWELGLLDPKLP